MPRRASGRVPEKAIINPVEELDTSRANKIRAEFNITKKDFPADEFIKLTNVILIKFNKLKMESLFMSEPYIINLYKITNKPLSNMRTAERFEKFMSEKGFINTELNSQISKSWEENMNLKQTQEELLTFFVNKTFYGTVRVMNDIPRALLESEDLKDFEDYWIFDIVNEKGETMTHASMKFFTQSSKSKERLHHTLFPPAPDSQNITLDQVIAAIRNQPKKYDCLKIVGFSDEAIREVFEDKSKKSYLSSEAQELFDILLS